jgi:L-ascorbate metabolism protein UlaG (beta-lactamase superfamily)
MGMERFKEFAIFALIASIALLRSLGADAQPPALDVTYLGNEGFLVRSGSQAVLFDALFGAGLPDYDHVPANVANDIEMGRPPFSNIDLVFISHIHPDHFELPSTVRFLESHPSAVVVAPSQVSQQLRRAVAENDRMLSQIHGVSAEKGRIIEREERGIQVGIFPLSHGNVENLAYLIRLNGREVLHLGDADLPMKGIAQFKLPDYQVALAFVPYWQLTENAACVRDEIAARVVIPMHLITHPTTASSKEYLDHIGGSPGMLARIRSEFPSAVVFHTALETKTF